MSATAFVESMHRHETYLESFITTIAMRNLWQSIAIIGWLVLEIWWNYLTNKQTGKHDQPKSEGN